MTRSFRAPGDLMPAKPPKFPHKPPANCPPRRQPYPTRVEQDREKADD